MTKNKHSKKIKAIWTHKDKLYILTQSKLSKKDEKKYKEKYKKKNIEAVTMNSFFLRLMEYNTHFFISIRNGEVQYDPFSMVDIIKENIKKGRMAGTQEMLLKKFIEVRNNLKGIKKIKVDVLENIYASCIEAAQAGLVMRGAKTLVPKKVPEMLKKHLLGKDLEKSQIKACKEIIKFYKDFEHGKIKSIKGKKLDKLTKKAKNFREAVDKIEYKK